MKKTHPGCLDARIEDVIKRIGRLTAREGIRAFLVGGIVRDLLLGRSNVDVDIVVEDDATKVAWTLSREMKAELLCHRQFGTATLQTPRGLRIDLASARKEAYPHPGALPVVSPGSLRDDLFRRDFTINGLAMDISPGRYGHIIDAFGGLQDVKAGRIRILHRRSFEDDPTRILRAVRFEQRFDFLIEPFTLGCLKSAVRRRLYLNVKPARYFHEFRKILTEPRPSKCIKRLHMLRALKFIHERYTMNASDLRALRKAELCLGRLRGDPRFKEQMAFWQVYLMILLRKLPVRAAESLARRLQLNRRECQNVITSFKAEDVYRKLKVRRIKPSEVFEILGPYGLETVIYFRVMAVERKVKRLIDRYLIQDRRITLKLDGRDIQAMGVYPGKKIGEILKIVLHARLNGKIATKREERQLARQLIHER